MAISMVIKENVIKCSSVAQGCVCGNAANRLYQAFATATKDVINPTTDCLPNLKNTPVLFGWKTSENVSMDD